MKHPDSSKPEQFAFLRPEITATDLKASFAKHVKRLENLPKNVREQVPEGFVVKEWDPTVMTVRALYRFPYLEPGEKHDLGQDAETLARMMRDEYDHLRRSFHDILPDLVVKERIVVGKKDATSSPKVYSIQDYADIEKAFELTDLIYNAACVIGNQLGPIDDVARYVKIGFTKVLTRRRSPWSSRSLSSLERECEHSYSNKRTFLIF